MRAKKAKMKLNKTCNEFLPPKRKETKIRKGLYTIFINPKADYGKESNPCTGLDFSLLYTNEH